VRPEGVNRYKPVLRLADASRRLSLNDAIQIARDDERASFLAFLAARFSSSVFAGFLRSCFFWSMPLLMCISSVRRF
jgi:hypothetical protein